MKKLFVVVLHTGYWLLYLSLIAAMIRITGRIGTHRSVGMLLSTIFYPPLVWGAIFPAVLSFYTFYFFIFPRFLQRKRFAGLLISCAAAVLLLSLLSLTLIYLHPPLKKAYSRGELLAMLLFLAFVCLVHGVIALIMKGFVSWYGDIRWKEQLIRRSDEMELALIKSQLNPHFLFNTLNNIDVLIGKDPDLASAYLNKLSDILRFMLYETRTEKIPLEKELLYIGKYIDLQKIRTSNPDHIQYMVEGAPEGWIIAPMLFMPFIENAFKHADNKKTAAMRVSLRIEKDTLHFECENTYGHRQEQGPDHSGLGNDLIKKRLKLLYPDNHVLEIADANMIYKAKLMLTRNAH
jgi:hypothetical protein